MAVTTESFNSNGELKVFTVASTILSQSHCRVDFYYDDGSGELTDHAVASNLWDVINNSIVFKEAPDNGYIVKITISTDGEGLDTPPSDLSSLAAEINDVLNVNDNLETILEVNDNIDVIREVGESLPSVRTCSNNIEAINNVAASTTSTGLLAAINIGSSTVAIDSEIPEDTNGLSFSPLLVDEATVTVKGSWRII